MSHSEDPLLKGLGDKHRETILALESYLYEDSGARDELFLSTNEFGTRFLSKAPVDFLERHTLEELAELTRTCHQTLEAFQQQGEAFLITKEAHQDRAILHIAIGDRPFIINSLRECINDFGATIFHFIHPIFIRDGYNTSLSYIEISATAEEELEVLVRRIRLCLEQVVQTTDDFAPMLGQVETLARLLDTRYYSAQYPQEERKEVSSFLRWLIDHHFIFLGYIKWKVGDDEQTREEAITEGIYCLDNSYAATVKTEVEEDCITLLQEEELISVSKLRSTSVIHRRNRLTHILVREISPQGQLVAIHSITGLFTSNALNHESSRVPLIRRKLQALLQAEMVVVNSHEHKNIVHILDSMPKEEILSIDLESLQKTVHTILDIQNNNETRVSIRFDTARRGASVLIVMPRDRFNTNVRHRVQEHIEKIFGVASGSSEYYLDLSSKPHARFYFLIPFSLGRMPPIDLAALERKIVELTQSWKDHLEEEIFAKGTFDEPAKLWHTYGDAFAEDYQALQSVEDCLHDIKIIDTLTASDPIQVSMRPSGEGPAEAFMLIVYNFASDITISKALPLLENAGLEVLKERAFVIGPTAKEKIYLHRFLVKPKGDQFLTGTTFDEVLAPGLQALFLGNTKNDILNSLMLSANLNTEAITLLRSYCYLLWQVSSFATRSALFRALAETPTAANQLWNMFDIRFHPAHSSTPESRTVRFDAAMRTFHDSLRDVKDITLDRILRSLADLLAHTVRTNFFVENRESIALKIHSEKVEIMPSPKPLFETYVWSEDVEGVHLRSDLVSRGGIRFSDRHQDFRSEILGLMKTQKSKNALIVPAGAKGGFIVKRLSHEPELKPAKVEAAYKLFIRSLLSISDNRILGAIQTPKDVICYDGEDPYLVVAADKGTATFSDIANGIATQEFDFWLGDAFASGGSIGYDHKRYGITAKGAWESVVHHFREIGIDDQKDPFRVVGIGDMSGDVFGNGMLLSQKIKLIAAFNHKHIFIDPDPDPEKSFQERKRLFETPRTQWTDYSEEILSKGGAIYERFGKEITLSPEAQEALGLGEDAPETMDGESLIRLILSAPCELIWNGGIGTYIKSRRESNADVNDGTNDRVRINADEVRAKVIGEGGNLGCTQRARIDFARSGGLIHTDAIDNSAGVDLSDHEVNLKILFRELELQESLTREERNKLLEEIDEAVVEDVLRNNKSHALILTFAQERSRNSIEYFRTLITELVKRGYIDRELDALPSDEELVERAEKKRGLVKPELALCLAAVKLHIKDELAASELSSDSLLYPYLLDYFPESLRERYEEDIHEHPLAKNIIATQATNTLVNAVGITFIHRMCLNFSAPPLTVIKCLLAAHILTGAKRIRNELRAFDTFESAETYAALNSELNRTIRESARWMLVNHPHASLKEIVSRYQNAFYTLFVGAGDILVGSEREYYENRLAEIKELPLPEATIKSFATFPRINILLEMVWTSQASQASAQHVVAVYSAISELLDIDSIYGLEKELTAINKWENELLQTSLREIRRSLSLLAVTFLKNNIVERSAVRKDLKENKLFERTVQIIKELKQQTPNIASIAVLAKNLTNYHDMIYED